MRDLTDVMADSRDARATSLDGLRPGESEVAGLTARVRRRRVVRHTVEAAVTLPVVAAIAIGGWMLMGDRTGPPPVTTPTPSPTSTEPSPSPSPEETPGPEIVLGDPITEPGLPPYYPMPLGLLDRTGPGWVLGTYAPRAFDVDFSRWGLPETEVVFLVSPEGVRFEAARFDLATVDGTGTTWTEHELVSWQAGARTAVVQAVVYTVVTSSGTEDVEPGGLMTLDLLTGVVAPTVGDPPSDLGVLNSRGDLRLGTGAVTEVGTGTVLGSLDGETASGWCEPVAWWTADSILATCVDDDAYNLDIPHLELNPRLVTFDMAQLASGEGVILRPLAEGEQLPMLWGSDQVSDGVVVVQATTLTPGVLAAADCPSGVYLLTGETTERLPASDSHPDVELNIFEADAIGRTVYVESTGGCSGGARPSILTSYDLDDATFIELIGPPPRDGQAEYRWIQGLTSYVVGE